METIKLKNHGNTKMIAHRGLSGIYLENTVKAFKEAGKENYYGIESDVHITRDGKFIIFHDDTTRRLAGINLEIERTDYKTLRLLPIKFHRMPSLAEYILCCKNSHKIAVLELKNEMKYEDISGIVDDISKLGYIDSTVFISFSSKNLIYIRNLLPKQTVQLLSNKFSSDILDLLISNKWDLDIHYSALNESIVELCHDNKIKVNCWTVNQPADAERLIDYGVDYITTNILV